MKKILLIIILVLGFLWGLDVLAQNWTTVNCTGNNCFKAGVDAAGKVIGGSSGIVTGKGIARAAQDVIKYFLSFLTLIAVIYIMYAGAQMLLNPASEESGEKTKKIIISVILGISIIWFAWWIVSTIFYILNNDQVASRFVPRAVAETQIRNVDFNTYRNKILALKTRIVGAYSPEIMNELTVLVDGAYDHLPDRADMYANQQLYDRVKTAIADYNLHREEIDLGQLQNALDAYLEQTLTFSIQGNVSAAPSSGDAPLSVTLEGKNVIDSSDTTLPENNYIWWLRTPEGSKILGRGKTINHTFNDEGTYTVNLTVNSASKNTKGFNDTINFEDQVTIDVGQPKAKFLIYFNDQLASDTIKIPLKEAEQDIIIDARQTRFSSGYTISKTEWDYGNGVTDMNDGGPQVEFQKYRQGEHNIKLKLTRNDGEVFEKSIIMRIGDPIASIATNNTKPNKGEKVTFQAKKINQEGVTFSWEIRKEGSESILYAVNGPRAEYAFREIGNYGVSLISSKGDARDKETMQIYIDSRPPVVRFDAQPENSETPNIYFFDGTATYDPDYPDGRSMKYEWFVNDKPVNLTEANTGNSRGTYMFPEKGTYQIELQVSDEEGKVGSFKKTITIKNLLSVQLSMRPQIANRGQRILLSASAADAQIYEWNIPGLDPVVKDTGRHVVSFEKAGTYDIVLKVTNDEGEVNTLRRKIYIVNGEEPFAVMNITSRGLVTQVESQACDDEDALIVDRVTPVTFAGDKSVNVGGDTNDLNYYWQIGLNKTSTQRNITHNFDELGCELVTFSVTDKKTGTSNTSTQWVKVVNIAPRFSDIEVVVENIDMDPMKVDLRIQGAKDPDGVIRSYTWYYSTTPGADDPLGFRITTKPETSFVLPKVTGRYYFSVIMEDSNGLRVDTKNISDSSFSTPDLLVNQNLAAPIIGLNVGKSEVAYGEEVVFTVDVKNALEKDISEDAEYRWDIDGDGFYDIKTAVPTYTFKYANPGEYKPKVKVTHKGLSATKSATITVTNRLVPDADIQIIGNKLIAYNTSTGIYQSISWLADGKKISENKEYLYYDAGESFPKSLKIIITDGKQTEEKEFAIARNPAGSVMVKKITTPLVLLGNTGNISELPDDITWSDPEKPLYLYMGESKEDTKYYVIDTDIEIDTDLSGGREDDADNKGTASYRLGRPFRVPVGTKRVTIMKLRILADDGKELGSRQIRVTRAFIAQADLVDTTTTQTPTDGPKQYNLSQEDKERLDRLTTLVKNVPEAERQEFTRYIDQLGDIWYDRADRAETLLQFSNAIEQNSTISPDLKERLLTQINLIYTQGQQDTEEKVLARKMIEDFLANSPYKKEIFGETPGEGLIDQIIDNPEYYDQNMSIAGRIYEEYVAIDTGLSEEAKAVIKERLMTLVGNPLDPSVVTNNPDVDETDTGGTSLMTYIKKYGVIAGGIIIVILGIMVLMAVFRRGGSSVPEFPSNEHANTDNGPSTRQSTESFTPSAVESHESTPDWLRESESPFGGEDILSKPVDDASSNDHLESTVPDWAQDNHDTPTEASLNQTETVMPKVSEPITNNQPPATASDDDVPDWLKGLHDEPTDTPVATGGMETPATEVISPSTEPASPAPTNVTESISSLQSPVSSLTDDDVPDWLRGAVEEHAEATTDSTGSTEEKNETPSATVEPSPFASIAEPQPAETTSPTSTSSTESISSLQSPVSSLADDDIPEWLRGADTAIEEPTTVDTPSTSSGGLFGEPEKEEKGANLTSSSTEKNAEAPEPTSNIELPISNIQEPVLTSTIAPEPLPIVEKEIPAEKKSQTLPLENKEELKSQASNQQQKPKNDKWKNKKHWKNKNKQDNSGNKPADPKKQPENKKKIELLSPAHELLGSPTHEIEPAHDLLEESPKKRKSTSKSASTGEMPPGMSSKDVSSETIQNSGDNGNNGINGSNGLNV